MRPELSRYLASNSRAAAAVVSGAPVRATALNIAARRGRDEWVHDGHRPEQAGEGMGEPGIGTADRRQAAGVGGERLRWHRTFRSAAVYGLPSSSIPRMADASEKSDH